MVSAYGTLGLSLEMDFVLLWLTAKLAGYRPRPGRLTLAAAMGALPTLWVLWRQNLYATPWEFSVLWPAVMLPIGLGRLARRQWMKTYLLFAGLTLLAAGVMLAGLTWFGSVLPYQDWAPLVPGFLAGGMAVLPVKTVRRVLGQHALGEVAVTLAGRGLAVRVLWDSGNRLQDPVSRRPVMVLETEVAVKWLPSEVLDWVRAGAEAARVPDAWRGRLVLVRFDSLGGEGVMPAVAVDAARGYYLGRQHDMVPLMVGFSARPVSSDGSYRGLVAPSALVSRDHEGVGA
ncbi:MAG: sigma-E processing peptidase SpoIIGA [Thermaerobacter sp.]|nr:sigma-E processing peptidase SpoIIGA [Thermaerobacter sp.]